MSEVKPPQPTPSAKIIHVWMFFCFLLAGVRCLQTWAVVP